MHKDHLTIYQLLYLITILTSLDYTLARIQISKRDLITRLKENFETTTSHLPQFDMESNMILKVKAMEARHSDFHTKGSNSSVNVDDISLRATVNKIPALDTVSQTIGWLYFISWTLSFYPQAYSNWKRKSVIGLHFDMVALNLIGYILYTTFTLGLFFNEGVKIEYFKRYPGGQIPVKINDVYFVINATAVVAVTAMQCFIYERGKQRISYIGRCFLGTILVFISVSIILAAFSVITWLDFLYYCSYVKLSTTMIKYIPQAYLNYQRKTTEGWSIANVLLDFTGGNFSVLQMILDAYNYDDWDSIFGDPTKFGLGVFSVAFDILFIIQHYVLYRHANLETK